MAETKKYETPQNSSGVVSEEAVAYARLWHPVIKDESVSSAHMSEDEHDDMPGGFPFLQFTPKELEQEVLKSEASGKGLTTEQVWAELTQRHPWLCK